MPIRWLKVGFGNLGFLFMSGPWCYRLASILGGWNQFITNKQGSYHMKPTQCQCTLFRENPRKKMTPHRFATEVHFFWSPQKEKGPIEWRKNDRPHFLILQRKISLLLNGGCLNKWLNNSQIQQQHLAIWATKKKKRPHFPLYWLVNGDPSTGSLHIIPIKLSSIIPYMP